MIGYDALPDAEDHLKRLVTGNAQFAKPAFRRDRQFEIAPHARVRVPIGRAQCFDRRAIVTKLLNSLPQQ